MHQRGSADRDLGDPRRILSNSKLVEDASNMLKSREGDTQRLALNIITIVVRHGKFQRKCEAYMLSMMTQ